MKERAKIWVWAVALAFLAVPALAGSAEAQETDWITLTDLSGAEIGNYDTGSYYVGRYGFQLGSTPGGSTYDFYCVDFSHRINYGQTIEAHFTSMAGVGSSSPTYLSSLDTYRKAAYLTTQFQEDNRDQWGAIHAAIWNITGAYPTGGDADDALPWVLAAEENYTNISASNWTVVTPLAVNGTQYQEFVTYTVPEPASMLLLGSGLLGMAWLRRRNGNGSVEENEELA